jgi:hypothetical protein
MGLADSAVSGLENCPGPNFSSFTLGALIARCASYHDRLIWPKQDGFIQMAKNNLHGIVAHSKDQRMKDPFLSESDYIHLCSQGLE